MTKAFGHRRSVRLPGFDYGWNGYYFLTICTQGRHSILGTIVGGEVLLSPLGTIVQQAWEETPTVRPDIRLDAFVIMPNHIHGIIQIVQQGQGAIAHEEGRTGRAPLPMEGREFGARDTASVSTFVAGFKATTTHRINRLMATPGSMVWQRNFHEHILRDEADLYHHRQYVGSNPANWQKDTQNPGYQA